MTCTELYQLMDNPAMFSEKTLFDLRQLISDFPYFHAARMLYLKNLAVIQDIRQKVELKKMAIYIPDLMKLFMLIEDELTLKPVLNQETETIEKEDSYLAAENILPETDVLEDSTPEDSVFIKPTPLPSADYTQWLLNENQTSDPSAPQLQHQDLIDSFLWNEKARPNSRRKMEPVLTDEISNDISKGPESTDKSIDNLYFTETLANIYIKQKRYEKALEIIKNLSLKYPKKNIYFADQIRFLEKLIIYTKK